MADPRLSERLREHARWMRTNLDYMEAEIALCEDAARLAELVESLQGADKSIRAVGVGPNPILNDALAALLAFDLSGGSQTGRDR